MRSSAPIGCPPGLWASVQYIQRISRGEQHEGHPQRDDRIDAPLGGHVLRILVDLVIGHQDHDRQEYAQARRAALGRDGQRHGEQRHEQHHRHLDQPEMDDSRDRLPARAGGVVGLLLRWIKFGQEEFVRALAPAAEGVDHRQIDRQIVVLEAQHARRAIAGRVVHKPALGQPQDDRVGIVGREERALVRRDRQRPAGIAFNPDEYVVQAAAFVVAPLDPQRHALAEVAELADLDRARPSAPERSSNRSPSYL